ICCPIAVGSRLAWCPLPTASAAPSAPCWRAGSSPPRAGALRSRPWVSSPPLFLLAIAEFIGGSVFWSSAAWTPTALRTAKGLSLQQTGWIMSVLSLANMLGSFSLGSLSDKFGRKAVIALSAFPAALAAFIVFFWLQSPVGLA